MSSETVNFTVAEYGTVAHWIKQNQLKMNVSKTQLMVLSRRCRKCEAERIRIQLDGSILVSNEKVRYLGVDIDKNFTLKDQGETKLLEQSE